MIRHLSEDVRTHIRTGVTLPSFAQVVEELVLNSIDAGAFNVAVRVDLHETFKVQVVDNGSGIAEDDLAMIGERYATSKCHTTEDLENLKYFGYRGEALASLCTSSTFVEITSRVKSSTATFCKCFQNGQALPVKQNSSCRPSPGTTVTAYDIFYNYPVRRNSLNERLEIENIRYRVAGLALIWPQISISLKDDWTDRVILKTIKRSGVMATFSDLFTAARARGLAEISACKDEFKVSGLVSKESYSRKDIQFVYVNKRLVLKSSIHRQMNKILGRSMILKKKIFNNETSVKQVNNSTTGSPNKQTDKYGIYVINIECPLSAYDITFDPSKTLVEFRDWPKLIHLLQDMVYGFLRQENLLSFSEPFYSKSPLETDPYADNDDDDEDADCDTEDSTDQRFPQSSMNVDIQGQNSKISHLHKFRARDSKGLPKPDHIVTSKPVSKVRKKRSADKSKTSDKVNVAAGRSSKSSFKNKHDDEKEPDSEVAISKRSVSGMSSNENHQGRLCPHQEAGLDTTRMTFVCDKTTDKTSGNRLRQTTTEETYFDRAGHAFDPVPDLFPLSTAEQNTKSYDTSEGASVSAIRSDLESPIAVQSEKTTVDEDPVRKSGSTKAISKPITLGHSVSYKSTLQTLRDINPNRESHKKSQIVTNTLQELKQSSKKIVAGLGNTFKTPEQLIRRQHSIDDSCEDEPHTKYPKCHGQNESNNASKQNKILITDVDKRSQVKLAEHCEIDSDPFSESASKRQESSTLNANDALQVNSSGSRSPENRPEQVTLEWSPQKGKSCASKSASKLARLMKGEKLQGKNANCGEENNPEPKLDHRKAEMLHSFRYRKQKEGKGTEQEPVKDCGSAPKKTCTRMPSEKSRDQSDKSHTSLLEKSAFERSDASKSHIQISAPDFNKVVEKPLTPDSDSTSNLPFSMYQSTRDSLSASNSPQVTEVLSLDIDKADEAPSKRNFKHHEEKSIQSQGFPTRLKHEEMLDSLSQSTIEANIQSHNASNSSNSSPSLSQGFQVHTSNSVNSELSPTPKDNALQSTLSEESMTVENSLKSPTQSQKDFDTTLPLSGENKRDSGVKLMMHGQIKSSDSNRQNEKTSHISRDILKEHTSFKKDDLSKKIIIKDHNSQPSQTENDKEEGVGFMSSNHATPESCQVHGDDFILAYDTILSPAECNTVPETEEFQFQNVDATTSAQVTTGFLESASTADTVCGPSSSVETVCDIPCGQRTQVVQSSSEKNCQSQVDALLRPQSSSTDTCEQWRNDTESLFAEGSETTGIQEHDVSNKSSPHTSCFKDEHSELPFPGVLNDCDSCNAQKTTPSLNNQSYQPLSKLSPNVDILSCSGDQALSQMKVTSGRSEVNVNNEQIDHSLFMDDQGMDAMSSSGDQALAAMAFTCGGSIRVKENNEEINESSTQHDQYKGVLSSWKDQALSFIKSAGMIMEENGSESCSNINLQQKETTECSTDNCCQGEKNPTPRTLISVSGASSNVAMSSMSLLRRAAVIDNNPSDECEYHESQVPTSKDNETSQSSKNLSREKISISSDSATCQSKDSSESKMKKRHLTNYEPVVTPTEDKTSEQTPLWSPVTDSKTGKMLYVQTVSCYYLSEEQWAELPSQEQRARVGLEEEKDTKQKSCTTVSPADRNSLQEIINKHMEEKKPKDVSKNGEKRAYGKEGEIDSSHIWRNWKNPVFQKHKEFSVLPEMRPSDRTRQVCFDSVSLVKFTKDMLHHCKVIGHIDNKFISCTIEKESSNNEKVADDSSCLLVLFDQHAVDERIKLEHFEEKAFELRDGTRSNRIRRVEIKPAHSFSIGPDDIRIMEAFDKEFDRIGVNFYKDKVRKDLVHITTIPACMTEKQKDDIIRRHKNYGTAENIETLIKEHVELLKSTNGACGRLPMAIHRILCSKACRGAVKFGDPLTLSECRNLLSLLKKCNLPFQCAHGRPSLTSWIDISALENESKTPRKKPKLSTITEKLQNY